tara:strand:- start:6568 stop:7314 length:747 start_codon:yes stop_codon:yes gene_type:complete
MIVITGTQSGLGKFFKKKIKNSISINKFNYKSKLKELKNKKIDTLIHCAFSKVNDNYFDLYEKNIIFLNQLLDLNIKKFIFISSIYVSQYEKYDNFNKNLNYYNSLYTFLKKISEEIILKKHNNSLILRCSSFITPFSKENNIYKLMKNNKNLSITKNSNYNIIDPNDLLKICKISINKKNIKGIFNICANNNLSAFSMAKLSNFNKKFGRYKFTYRKVSVYETYKKFDFLNKSSKENYQSTYRLIND